MGYDPELGWRLLPDVEKRGPFWGVDEPARTNSRGWRDAEHPLAKPPGVRRIVALGDSFTFGVDADYGERYTEVLERDVERCEVVNLGVNAFGTAQELRALEVYGLAYDPDVVVLVVFLGNDLDDIRTLRRGSWPSPYYRLEDGELELVPPVLTWDVRVRTASYVGEYLMRALGPELRSSIRAPEWETADTVPLFAALVARMAAVSEQHDARFLAVLTYNSSRAATGPTEREARARAALEQAGVAVVDALPAFTARREAGEELFAGGDGHWNAAGHALVADLIRRALAKRGWL